MRQHVMVRAIAAAAPRTTRPRNPDQALITLLTGSKPLTEAQWQRIREIENDAEMS